jgi:hypothetical protein
VANHLIVYAFSTLSPHLNADFTGLVSGVHYKQGVLIKTLMADYRLSKSSVYRYLNQVA